MRRKTVIYNGMISKDGILNILNHEISNLHWTEKMEIICLSLMLASIPINAGASLFFASCWFVCVALKNSILKRWSFFTWHQDKNHTYNKNTYMLIPMMLYWLAYLISLLWTDNLSVGWAEVGQNAWFFAIPFVCLCTDFRQISQRCLRAMLWLFVITLTAVFFYLLAKALIVTHQQSSVFLKSGLSVFHNYIHYTYSTLYIASGLAFLYTEWIRDQGLKLTAKILILVCAVCLVLFVILLNSRAGILYLILLLLMCVFHTFFLRKKYRLGIIFLVSAVALVALLHFTLPEKLHRFSNTTTEIVHGDMSDSRFMIMKNAWTVVKEHPLMGVGAGDRKDSLTPLYGELNHVYNPHNQFLDTWLGTGVCGMLILWLMVLLPLLVAYKNQQIMPMMVNIMLIAGLMVESMLERQMGVAFLTVISVYYLLLCDPKRMSQNI